MSQGPKTSAKVGTFKPRDAIAAFVSVELPALGKREHLRFALGTGRNEDALDGVRDLVRGICMQCQGAIGPDTEKAEQQLTKLGKDAAAEVETWRIKVKMADEWKRKVENAAATMNKMREDYFKELMHLREQVYQQDKLRQVGVDFHPTYAAFFDPSEYTMDAEVRQLTRLKVAMLEEEYETRLGEVEVKHMARVRDLKEQVFVARFTQQKKHKLIQMIKAEFNLSSSKLQEMVDSAKVNEEKLEAKIQEQMDRAEEIALKAYEEAKAKEKAWQEELKKRMQEPSSMQPKGRLASRPASLDPKVVEALKATERKPGDPVPGIEYEDFSDCSDEDDSDFQAISQSPAASSPEGPPELPSRRGKGLVRAVKLLPGASVPPRALARAIELLPSVEVLPDAGVPSRPLATEESRAEACGGATTPKAVASVEVQTMIDYGTLTVALDVLGRETAKGSKLELFAEESRWRAAAIHSISSARSRSRSRGPSGSTAHEAPEAPLLAEDTDSQLCSPVGSRAGSRTPSMVSSGDTPPTQPAQVLPQVDLAPAARGSPHEPSPAVQAILSELHAGTDVRCMQDAAVRLVAAVRPSQVDAETQVEGSWSDGLPSKLRGMMSRPSSKDSADSAGSGEGSEEFLLSCVTCARLRERIRAALERARAFFVDALPDFRAPGAGWDMAVLERVLRWLEEGPASDWGGHPGGGARRREGSHSSGVVDVHRLRIPSKYSDEAGSVVYFNAHMEANESEQARGWRSSSRSPSLARARSIGPAASRASKSRSPAQPEGHGDGFCACVGPHGSLDGPPPEPKTGRCVCPKLPKITKRASGSRSPRQPSTDQPPQTARTERQDQPPQTARTERQEQLPALAASTGSPTAVMAAAAARLSLAQRSLPAASLRMPATQRVHMVTPPPGAQRTDLITPPPAPGAAEEQLMPGWSGLLPPVGFSSHRPAAEAHTASEPAQTQSVGTPSTTVKSPTGSATVKSPTGSATVKRSAGMHASERGGPPPLAQIAAPQLDGPALGGSRATSDAGSVLGDDGSVSNASSCYTVSPSASLNHSRNLSDSKKGQASHGSADRAPSGSTPKRYSQVLALPVCLMSEKPSVCPVNVKPALGVSRATSDAGSVLGGDGSLSHASSCYTASPSASLNQSRNLSDSNKGQVGRGSADRAPSGSTPRRYSQVLALLPEASVCLLTEKPSVCPVNEKGGQSARSRLPAAVGARHSIASTTKDAIAFGASERRSTAPDMLVVKPGSPCAAASPPRSRTDLDLPKVTERAKGSKRGSGASVHEANV